MEKKKLNPFMKFFVWMVVIIVMGMAYFIKDNNENHWTDDFKKENTEQIVEDNNDEAIITYSMMQDVLKNNNYDFIFTINNSNKYTFTGRRCNGLEEGFKESKDSVIKYIINEDGNTYKIVNDEYLLIDDLYGDFDNSFLNINLLFDNLKTVLYNELISDDDKTIYSYLKDGYQVEVIIDNNNIETININNDDTTYMLEFSNIGKCAKIDFDN